MDDNAPAWEQPITLSLIPENLFQTLFATASNVHTGWSSCIDNTLTTSDLFATDDRTGNYIRLAEQEFVEDEDPDVLWHDWTVEIRIGEVLLAGHWQIQVSASPLDWQWCAREAEIAFEKAAVLVGKRVRRVPVVEEVIGSTSAPQPRHH